MTTHSHPHTLDWLLEASNPSVRYRTLCELLDCPPDDPEVLAAKTAIPTSAPVEEIFRHMDDRGVWTVLAWRKIDTINGKVQRKKVPVGDGSTDYQDFYTTHFNLAYLAELGLDRQDVRVDLAANRYLNLLQSDDDLTMSCLTGYNLRTFTLLGYGADMRVQRLLAYLLKAGRADGGYLCHSHEDKYPDRPTKSCIRGSVKALTACAEYQKVWKTPTCQALVDYFLTRHGMYKAAARSYRKPILDELSETYFPFTWRSTVLEILVALSKMGFGRHPALKECWEQLDRMRDDDGRYRLTQVNRNAYFIPTVQAGACKWITFYAFLAQKYRAKTV